MASIHNISTKLTTTLAAELTGLMCIHFDDSSHTHFCSALWFHSEEKVWLCNSGLKELTDCCCDCDSDRYNIPLLILAAQGRAPDASRTLSSLFCQLSSLFTIRSMQWESVAKIPAVVALNVMASPLKSIPLMPLWLKHWNTDGEREHIQLHSLEIHLKDIILLDSVTVSKAGTMWWTSIELEVLKGAISTIILIIIITNIMKQ